MLLCYKHKYQEDSTADIWQLRLDQTKDLLTPEYKSFIERRLNEFDLRMGYSTTRSLNIAHRTQTTRRQKADVNESLSSHERHSGLTPHVSPERQTARKSQRTRSIKKHQGTKPSRDQSTTITLPNSTSHTRIISIKPGDDHGDLSTPTLQISLEAGDLPQPTHSNPGNPSTDNKTEGTNDHKASVKKRQSHPSSGKEDTKNASGAEVVQRKAQVAASEKVGEQYKTETAVIEQEEQDAAQDPPMQIETEYFAIAVAKTEPEPPPLLLSRLTMSSEKMAPKGFTLVDQGELTMKSSRSEAQEEEAATQVTIEEGLAHPTPTSEVRLEPPRRELRGHASIARPVTETPSDLRINIGSLSPEEIVLGSATEGGVGQSGNDHTLGESPLYPGLPRSLTSSIFPSESLDLVTRPGSIHNNETTVFSLVTPTSLGESPVYDTAIRSTALSLDTDTAAPMAASSPSISPSLPLQPPIPDIKGEEEEKEETGYISSISTSRYTAYSHHHSHTSLTNGRPHSGNDINTQRQ